MKLFPFQLQRSLVHISVVIASFWIVFSLLFSPAIFFGYLLPRGDALAQSFPAVYSPVTLWSPLLFAGYPVGADPQGMLWYPFARLASLSPVFWNIFAVSAYVLASCFSYGFVYSVTGSKSSAAVSGIVFGMSGFMMAHLGHTNMVHSGAWLPLILWSFHKNFTIGTATWSGIGAIAVGCSALAGHPQTLLYSLMLASAYAIVLLIRLPDLRWRGLFLTGVSITAGIGLASIVYVPLVELARESVRSELTFLEFTEISLSPAQLRRLVFPLEKDSRGLTEFTGYVGLLPLALAWIGARSRLSLSWFWIGVALLSVALTLGPMTPLASWTFAIPGYNLFRVPTRNFLEFTMAMSVLSGFGIAALTRMGRDQRTQTVRKGATITTVLFGVALAYRLYSSGDLEADVVWAAFILTAGVASLIYQASQPSVLATALVCLVVLIDLGYLGRYLSLRNIAERDEIRQPAALNKYTELLQRNFGLVAPIRGIRQPAEAAPPNRSRFWGIPSVSGYNPLALARYSELLDMRLDGALAPSLLRTENRTLDILSLRYLLVPRDVFSGQTSFSSHGFRWRRDEIRIALGSGCGRKNPESAVVPLPDVKANRLGLVTHLACSTSLTTGTVFARLNLLGSDGTSPCLRVFDGPASVTHRKITKATGFLSDT